MKNIYKISESLKQKSFLNFEKSDFLDNAIDSVKDYSEKAWESAKVVAEDVGEYAEKTWESIKDFAGLSWKELSSKWEDFKNVLNKTNKSPVSILDNYATEDEVLPKEIQKFLFEDGIKELILDKNGKLIKDFDKFASIMGINEITTDLEEYKILANGGGSLKIAKNVARLKENSRLGAFFIITIQSEYERNENNNESLSPRNYKGNFNDLIKQVGQLLDENITEDDKNGIFDEIKLKYDLPEETCSLLKNQLEIHKKGLEEKVNIKFSLARGEITEEDAQSQYDEHIQEQIVGDEGLSDYYSKFIKASVKNKLFLDQKKGSKAPISREKISKAVEYTENSGVNLGAINGIDIDNEGNTILNLNTIKTVHGTPIEMSVKINEAGETSMITPFFDEYHVFTNKNELQGILKLAQYNAIISQIINKKGGDNTELEAKLSDDNLEEIVDSFEKISCKGQNRYEVFDKICRNLFNKATTNDKQKFGKYLYKKFSFNKSSGNVKKSLEALTSEAIDNLKNGHENDTSKDIKLGTGTQVEFNSENFT